MRTNIPYDEFGLGLNILDLHSLRFFIISLGAIYLVGFNKIALDLRVDTIFLVSVFLFFINNTLILSAWLIFAYLMIVIWLLDGKLTVARVKAIPFLINIAFVSFSLLGGVVHHEIYALNFANDFLSVLFLSGLIIVYSLFLFLAEELFDWGQKAYGFFTALFIIWGAFIVPISLKILPIIWHWTIALAQYDYHFTFFIISLLILIIFFSIVRTLQEQFLPKFLLFNILLSMLTIVNVFTMENQTSGEWIKLFYYIMIIQTIFLSVTYKQDRSTFFLVAALLLLFLPLPSLPIYKVLSNFIAINYNFLPLSVIILLIINFIFLLGSVFGLLARLRNIEFMHKIVFSSRTLILISLGIVELFWFVFR